MRAAPGPGTCSPSFAAAANAFGLDLYARFRAGQQGNLALSPASIVVALAMTRAGARGATAEEMDRVLRVDWDGQAGQAGDAAAMHDEAAALLRAWNDPARTSYELRVVSRLFGALGHAFEPPFLALTAERYGAPLESLDFRGDAGGSRQRINDWIAARTSDRIRDLLPPLSIQPDTRLVLANAVYFLGRWARRFQPAATRPETFWAEGRREIRVPMMHQTERFRYAAVSGLKLLEMPYAGDELAMTVIVPDARDGLAELERRLSVAELDRWLAALADTRVAVALPRFRVAPGESVQLERLLAAMGMPTAFTARADFSAMANPPNPDDRLFLGAAYHKAFVQVDEAGTEAAAATALGMPLGGPPRPAPAPPEVRADHPFLFLIRDLRSGIILFLGRLVDPA
jgi:serpin B